LQAVAQQSGEQLYEDEEVQYEEVQYEEVQWTSIAFSKRLRSGASKAENKIDSVLVEIA